MTLAAINVSIEALPVESFGLVAEWLSKPEVNKWLTSEWRQSETGREAKFYSLTRAGRKQLAVEKESWSRLTDAVGLIFNEGE